MSNYSKRLHVRITAEQQNRLKRAASARGTSVAAIVRGAIALAVPPDPESRRAAADAILDTPPMAVPAVDNLLVELDEVREPRHG